MILLGGYYEDTMLKKNIVLSNMMLGSAYIIVGDTIPRDIKLSYMIQRSTLFLAKHLNLHLPSKPRCGSAL